MKRFNFNSKIWLAAGLAVLLAACQTPPGGSQVDNATRDRFLAKARTRYYNLDHAGLAKFQCRVRPDWDRYFEKQRATDPKTVAWVVRQLNQIDFRLAVNADGTVAMTHTELKTDNEQMRKGLTLIYSGIEQMSKGFFTVWGTFMFASPFPPSGYDYRLSPDGPGYKLSFDSQGSSIVETLNEDGVISQFDETSNGLSVKMQTVFTHSPAGLLFAGYDGTYDSQATHQTGEVRARLSYRKTGGFWLPRQLAVKGKTNDGSTFDFTIALDHCQTSRR